MRPRPRFDVGLFAEYAGALAVLASVVWCAHFFHDKHFLPQPYVFDTNDTFMDWFNTANYANRSGAYDVWHSVYPPISFVFLRIFSIPRCYGDPFIARDCDGFARATILAFYLVDAVLAYFALRKADRRTAIPRGLTFAFGLPLLFCLERGNLILVTLPFFIVAYGGIARSRFMRALAVAVTINFKPYLVVPSLSIAVMRDWRWIERAALLTTAVYLVTLALFGSGTLLEILTNMGAFIAFTNGQFFQFSYYSTSYATLLLIADSPFPILTYVSSHTIDTLMWLIPVVIRTGQLAAVAALGAAWLQPRAVPLARLAALCTGLHLITQSPGGYALTFLLFLVFLEPQRRVFTSIALISAYMLSLNYDLVIATVMSVDSESWLGGRSVAASFGLSVGQLLRPGLVLIIVWSLAFDTITQVILAHRRNRPSLGLMPA